MSTMSTSDRPESVMQAFGDAVNAGDFERAISLYEEDAAIEVLTLGDTIIGSVARSEFLAGTFAINAHLTSRPLRVIRTGDIALIVAEWTLSGKTKEGIAIHKESVATDVVRLGNDGVWRFVIDNPWGTTLPENP